MNIEDRTLEALLDWDRRRAHEENPGVDRSCCSDAKLTGDLQRAIANVKATDWLDASESTFTTGQLETASYGTASHSPVDQPLKCAVSMEELIARVVDLKVADRNRADQFATEDSVDTPELLLGRLVREGLLTPYQARRLCAKRFEPLIFGDYEVLDHLGAGGMGQVFRARHRKMGREVALKMLAPHVVNSPESLQRFQREVQASARLHHPNIVAAFDAREENGVHFLAMEYVAGVDLQQYVEANELLSVRDAVDCIRQTAEGLRYAHEQGIVHRDIKPSNLMLTTSDSNSQSLSKGTLPAGFRVKILDMGLARLEREATDASQQLTSKDAAMGTAYYMSPEQSLDARAADQRTDIYSLGCTLYFLLTARPPYQKSTSMQTILAHRDAEIPSLRATRSDVPAQLENIFQRMVAKQPDDRFASMSEVFKALDSLGQDPVDAADDLRESPDQPQQSASQKHASPTSRTKSDRFRRTPLLAAGVCALALIVLATVIVLQTAKGTVQIELAEGLGDDIQIELRKGDEVVIAEKSNDWTLKLANGDWQVNVQGGADTLQISPHEVTVERFGEQVVKVSRKASVSVEPNTTQNDASRQLAHWVIEQGGGFHIYGDRPLQGGEQPIRRVEDIPPDPFHILNLGWVERSNAKGVDENLGRLIAQLRPKGRRADKIGISVQNSDADNAFVSAVASNNDIGLLLLHGTRVTDEGLIHLRQMKGLHTLSLGSPTITCEEFGPIPNLTFVNITNGPSVGDEAMRRFSKQNKLSRLYLEHSNVTDKGVAALVGLDTLQELDLNLAKNVTDASCEFFAELPKLNTLALQGTAITDKGVAQLRNCKKLKWLNIGGLKGVTDVSFDYLLELPNLRLLEIENSDVTLRGTAEFKMQRPDCVIQRSSFTPEEIAAEIERIKTAPSAERD